MKEKLEDILATYEDLNARMGDPDVVNDQTEYVRLAKEHSAMTPLAEHIRTYFRVLEELDGARELAQEESDPEMRELATEELKELEVQRDALEEEMKVMMLPPDPRDDKNIIVEIRAGTGGDEAAIFAGDLYRMYRHYA